MKENRSHRHSLRREIYRDKHGVLSHRHFNEFQFSIDRKLVPLDGVLDNLKGLLPRVSDLDWAIRLATNDGPHSQRVKNRLILNLLAKIFGFFEPQGFQEIHNIVGISPKEEGFQYPIGLPNDLFEYLNTIDHNDIQIILEWSGDGPTHHVAMNLMLMNALTEILNYLEGRKRYFNPKIREDETVK